ncbi:hypothetical protein GobsT_59490 [Gemmata obscuriglobus]|uniref:Uncharacterized protein n=1 Tax=Gemmata obscuriglobus TaxID=114 RepID=A0A2Z3GXN9_9BACT|nr:hypothetical protein [Gemmata obscuriglobus]AWM36267.1 hypothetical protein C1280_04055 [Gemmata obscuriglobus]QEG31128.1 hypothetical protein GobsT_59490 [Gemmata obscuriglobus]VTS10465.1 unnamed protein product [Gemmata obscuriglobus UQM 2246]
MVTFFRASVRALLLLVALLAPARHALATETTVPTTAARTDPTESDDDSDGWLIVAGLVGAVVLVAWIASRLGEDQ